MSTAHTAKSFDMAHTDISNLANLLDANLQHERSRPAEQGTGYSLSEGTNFYGHGPNGADGSGNATGGACKFSSPGGIVLPSTAVDVQIGLPVPSMTKAGKELAQEKAARRNCIPRGDDIWADEEVTDVIVAPSATITSSTRIAPIPTKESIGARASYMHGAGGGEAQGRAEPSYEVLLRQKVGTEDIYLGVDFERDGSTAASEHVIVKVKLPLCEAGAKEISLDVKPFSMRLETPNDYFVAIPLPVQCIEGKAAAQWDVATRTLTATLDVDPALSKVKVM